MRESKSSEPGTQPSRPDRPDQRSAPETRVDQAARPGGLPLDVATVLALQGAAGNQAVRGMLSVQPSILPGAVRSDEGTPEQIQKAIDDDDPGSVKAINDFSRARSDQKLKLVEVLLRQVWLGPWDKRALARIFNSYGDLEQMEEPAVSLLARCVERGFSLHDLSRYDNLVFDFKSELKKQALDNLGANIEVLVKEADRLGASGDKPPTQAQDEAVSEQQQLAQEIKDAKRMMAAARKIIVGRHGFLGDPDKLQKPIVFDPDHEPVGPGIDPVTAPNPATHEMPWRAVYDRYSALAKAVASVLNKNPALYALTALLEDAPDQPAKPGEDPRLNYGGQQRITGFETLSIQDARKKIRDAFNEIYNNSRMTMGKVMAGQMNPLQFDSLVNRHLAGEGGPRWTRPYTKLACRTAVAEAESSFDKTMARIGIVLLLASVAIGTAGAATPVLGAILAAANVGTAAAGAAIATLNARDLDVASKSATSDQTSIVSPEKAGRAELDAIMYQFTAILAVAGEAAGALLTLPATAAGANLGAIDMMAPEARAAAVADALKTMDPGQVALRTGRPPEELLGMVAPRASSDPAAAAATSKLRDFLNRFGSPRIGPTAGEDKTVASLLRQAKMTIREYWSRVYGLGLREVNSVSLHGGLGDAELTYIKLIEDTPGREAGIYRNARTGEHAVVQGSGDWRGGMVEHLNNLPEAAGDRWILVEHYHPERNWAVQFPSGGVDASGAPFGDFAVLLADYGETNIAGVLQGQPSTAIRQRVTARIRFRDPATGQYHYTTYGYDPGRAAIGAFFVEAETETGALLDYSFRDISGIGGARADYQRHMAGIRPGQPVVKATP